MTSSPFSRPAYDIALEDGSGRHLVSGMTALMVFFVSLALAVNFALGNMTERWVADLTGNLTVEIKPPLPAENGNPTAADLKEFNARVATALEIARRHPAVTESRALTEKEIRDLIEPWLNESAAKALLLPALIDIRLKPDADSSQLQKDLVAAVPTASIDTHSDALSDIKTIARSLQAFVIILTGLIITLGVAGIAGIVRAKFAIHQGEVETLHLIGASDDYIARQFRRHAMGGTLRGALVGLCIMTVSLVAIAAVTDSLSVSPASDGALSMLRFAGAQWAALVIAPVFAGALIARLTAQQTVLRALRQMA
jgi:cell division transport system permease protein